MATLIRVDEVKEILGVKEAKAYKVIRQLNHELEEKGFLTVSGRIPLDYLKERFNLNDDGSM
ncbi:transcriptional regulator [Urinicoccus massiliensis]|uniref:transcriptional regulator n=1 Tax=Urinicoccus massiliensis TaxID=1723382 RepID=UPI00093143C5|nr:transcriptional regulator [Urinicoccus massiliensis]